MDYDPKSSHTKEFIHHGEIEETLAYGEANSTSRELTDEILAKAKEHRGLIHREVAALLDCGLEDKNQKIYELAEQTKRDSYGNCTMLFVPLYLSNYCISRCVYCPYHAKNKHIPRRKPTQDKIRREVMAPQDVRHGRLVLETGEDPAYNPIEYMLESINTIYGIKYKDSAIRRVNVNIAATTVESYRKFKGMGTGTYIPFQETYYKESYEKLHSTGPRYGYCYHIEAMDRAQIGGTDDVGCGVLFSLEPYRYEFAGFLMHAEHLEAVFEVGSHAISVPRTRRADDIDPDFLDNGIDGDASAKLIARTRIVVLYTGMTVSTKESQKTREQMLHLGISQISDGSKTSVGGYLEPEPKDECSVQLNVSGSRTLDQVMNQFMGVGYIPSFCMACYREGRAGDHFMSLCEGGQIQSCCHPNTLMTLEEYFMDYSSEETRCVGGALVGKKIGGIPKEEVRQIAGDNLVKIEQGVGDLRF